MKPPPMPSVPRGNCVVSVPWSIHSLSDPLGPLATPTHARPANGQAGDRLGAALVQQRPGGRIQGFAVGMPCGIGQPRHDHRQPDESRRKAHHGEHDDQETP